jgi:DNA recombination protein RmuC
MLRAPRRTSSALKGTYFNTVRYAASEVVAGGLVGLIVGAAISTFRYNNQLSEEKNQLSEVHNLALQNFEIEKKRFSDLNAVQNSTLNTEIERRSKAEGLNAVQNSTLNTEIERRSKAEGLNAVQNTILNTEIERRSKAEERSTNFEEEKNKLSKLNEKLAQESLAQNFILNQEIEKRSSIEAKSILFESERTEYQEERLEFFKSMGNTNKIGQWGELTLRRTVERAGLCQGTDFAEQVTINEADTSKAFRIDMMIYLPGNRSVIIDSKAPLIKYQNAISNSLNETERKANLKDYAAQIKAHVKSLSDKKYWVLIDPHPEFVIAFLPGEALHSVALYEDQNLLDFCFEKNVILASPSTLYGLLKVCAFMYEYVCARFYL